MRTKTTRILLAGAAAAALLATGCGTTADVQTNAPQNNGGGNTSAPKEAGDITIGVSMSLIDQFIQLLVTAVEEEGAAQGITVNVISAESDPVNQLSQVENFITQGNDAIIVNPVDTESAYAMTEKAVAAGVPLIYLNRCPADLPVARPAWDRMSSRPARSSCRGSSRRRVVRARWASSKATR